jgi:hypothetical protein
MVVVKAGTLKVDQIVGFEQYPVSHRGMAYGRRLAGAEK